MKSLAIVLSGVLVAVGLLLVSPAAANPEREDLTIMPQNPPHSGGGGTPAGSAAPRGGGSAGGSSTASSPSGGGTTGGGGAATSGGGGGYAGSPHYRGGGESARGAARLGAIGQAVPSESRPRGDRPVTGTAVPRGQVTPPIVPPYYPGYYPPAYYPGSPGYGYPWYGYGLWGYGYWGYGLGSFYYDPFWWGFSPWYGGYGYGGYGSGYGSGEYSYGQSAEQPTGEIKLRVKPKGAEVYVDGSFVGIVDDFDGAFQHLTLKAGQPHRIEIRRPGYETLGFDVRVDAGQTVTYRGEMQKTAQ